MGIRLEDICVNYGEKQIIKDVSFEVEDGQIVTIIGPNGCGKSTLLKAMSRCLKPAKGKVYLDEEDINTINTKNIAKKLAILPQTKNIPSDITVEELVSYGRYPHLDFRQRLKKEDRETIDWAIEKTGLKDLRKRFVSTLSGGENQRAWIAMSLAQKSKILLLDEPTTFLDISYQVEVLELVKELNNELDITVIMVLHDLNQAARYSDKIFVVNEGRLYKVGCPEEVINRSLLQDVFKIEADIYKDKINNCPYFIPNRKIKKVVNKII